MTLFYSPRPFDSTYVKQINNAKKKEFQSLKLWYLKGGTSLTGKKGRGIVMMKHTI
jgi:hypothetical protein